MEINADFIYYGILYFLFAEFMWNTYLDIRQIRVYKKHTHIPNELIGILSHETFEKARLYALDKSNFEIVKQVFSFAVVVAMLSYDGIFYLWQLGGTSLKYIGYDPEKHEILQSAAFMTLAMHVSTFLSIFFNAYRIFVIEEKHGFNKQTVSFFIIDSIKAFIVQQVITTPLICALVYIVQKGGDYFSLYLWIFGMGMTLFLTTIYPEYIAPLFDKYIPLPEGELKTEIEKLAQSIGFPLCKLFVVENSKRSSHSNAYFYGFFKNKRIVLFDTLLKDYTPTHAKEEDVKQKKEENKGCDNNEVLAVLGHELGHWKFNHNTKRMIIIQLNLLFVFLIFQSLFKYKPIYEAFGFYDSTPILIGFVILVQFVFQPYLTLLSFLLAIFSRSMEFQADKFAKTLGRSNHLKRALIKLNSDNLSFPIYDPWYSQWNHSHPPLLERLQALDLKDD